MIIFKLLNDNSVGTTAFKLDGTFFFTSSAFVLRNVGVHYVFDNETKHSTKEVDSVTYDMVNADDFTPVKVAVETKRPLMTPEQLDAAQSPVLVEVDLNELIAQPVRLEYGKLTFKFTAQASSIKLAKN